MGDPVYSDRKVRRASLTGVAPGTIVDYSYTVEERRPFLAGDFSESWSVTTGVPVMRSRYVVDLPASLAARVKERNLSFARAESAADGRRVYVWATGNVPKVRGEAFAADSDGVIQSIAVSSPTTWQEIAAWYAGLAKDRYAVTPAVAAKIKSVVAGARTRDDSIRAVHRWVAQDVRYVSIALGLGGFQPRAPQTVLETGFGDCKDKATLFVAALRSMGIAAYPVLLSSSGGVDRAMPSVEQFDHAIAAVEKLAGEGAAGGGPYVFTDLTTEITPYGSLPFSEQGEFALVVHPDGRGEEATMPADPITANRSETRVVGTVSEQGIFEGRYEETATGAMQYGLRDMLSTPLDSLKRAALLRGVASRWFEGADGDSLVVFDGKDLRATPRISLRIRHGRATSSSGDTEILTNPLGSLAHFARVADEIEERGRRRFPIDALKVAGASVGVTEVRMTLPAGWRARLPKNVSAAGPFGTFAAEYAQEGRVLRITRRTTGARGVLPPERVGDLLAYLRTVGSDDTRFIVIDKK
jgi:transglutaminase-like putative cysteine protease